MVVAPGNFSCSMWGLVTWPGFEPRCPAVGARSQPLDDQGSPLVDLFCGLFSLYFIYFHSDLCNFLPSNFGLASLVAQTIKNLPTMQDTQLGSLGQEDPLEKGMAIHSSILAWRIPLREEHAGLQSIGLQTVRHNWATTIHTQLWAYVVLLFLVPWGVKSDCLFKIFLFFLMQAWISINFPLRMVLAASHRSLNVVFLFSHLSRYF